LVSCNLMMWSRLQLCSATADSGEIPKKKKKKHVHTYISNVMSLCIVFYFDNSPCFGRSLSIFRR
jgi:hypothetical protein